MTSPLNRISPDRRPVRAWMAIGCFGIALLIYLSLMRNAPALELAQGDKIQHLAAYAVLMGWFAQLAIAIDRRLLTAFALVTLGVALEYAQRATGYRTFDYYDMLADALGVGLGWLLAPPRLPNLLRLAERLAAWHSP